MLKIVTDFKGAAERFIFRILYGSPVVRLVIPVKSAAAIALFPEPPFCRKDFAKNRFDSAESDAGLSSERYIALLKLVLSGGLSDAYYRNAVHTGILKHAPEFGSYDKKNWRLSPLSERIFNGLCAARSVLSEAAPPKTKEAFVIALVRQAVYFRRRAPRFKKSAHFALFVTRHALACICIASEKKFLPAALKALETALERDFNREGAFFTGNPFYQFNLTYELVTLRDALVRAGVSVPPILQKIILKSCDFLAFTRRPDGKLPVFSGGIEGESEDIDALFETLPAKTKPHPFKAPETGYYKLEVKDVSVFAEFKEKNGDKRCGPYERGSLAFELCAGGKRLLTNCGPGDAFGEEWRQALRSRGALGVLTLDNVEPTKSKEAGSDTVITAVNGQGVILEGVHSGYKKRFNAVYRRRLLLHKNGLVLQGEDWITFTRDMRTKKETPRECVIRFHIHPDAKAEISRTGSIVLSFKDEKSSSAWMFNCGSGKITLEDSVYTGGGVIKATKQIVITVKIRRETEKIRWALQYSAAPAGAPEKTFEEAEENIPLEKDMIGN